VLHDPFSAFFLLGYLPLQKKDYTTNQVFGKKSGKSLKNLFGVSRRLSGHFGPHLNPKPRGDPILLCRGQAYNLPIITVGNGCEAV
jgi:hypothetical protein